MQTQGEEEVQRSPFLTWYWMEARGYIL